MPKISRFSDLRSVFLPSDPAFQSPDEFSKLVLLTQDWSGGCLATQTPGSMFKYRNITALPAGTSTDYAFLAPDQVVPLDQCWRLVGAGIRFGVGTPNVQVGAFWPGLVSFVPLTSRQAPTGGTTHWHTLAPFAPAGYFPPGSAVRYMVDGAALNDAFELSCLFVIGAAGQGFNF